MKWELDLKEYRARGVVMGRAIACVAVALAAASLGCGESPPASQKTPDSAGGMGGVGGTSSPPALPLGGAGGVVGSAGSANGTGGAANGAGGTSAGQPAAGGNGGQGAGTLLEWPDATNTGVPPDRALTASGGLMLTTDGQVIEGVDIQGSIIVRASDVIIRDSRIESHRTAIRFEQGSNLLVERVTFDGKSATTLDGAIQAWGTITVRRIQVSGFGEGINIYGTGGLIEDSYFHDMKNAQGDLMDGIEAWEAQHLIIRHNWIEMPGGNSVIKLPLDVPVPGGDDVLIENNLVAGGGWAVYGGYDPPNSNPSYTNVRFIENRFSTMFEPKCGSYGAGAYIESALSHDNVWHETGEALEL